MRTEPSEFRTMAAGKLRKRFAKVFRPSRGEARPICSPDTLDEAFAVYARFDAGEIVGDNRTEPLAKNSSAILQSAARDLFASISAQMESIDRQRHEPERLLSDAEASA
jgi:hypothetical protein